VPKCSVRAFWVRFIRLRFRLIVRRTDNCIVEYHNSNLWRLVGKKSAASIANYETPHMMPTLTVDTTT